MNNGALPNGDTAALASLQTQVKGLEGDYVDLKNTVVTLDRKLEHSFAALSTKFETSLTALTIKLDDRGKPQWQMYGVAVAIIGMLAGFFFWPINGQMTDSKAAILENTRTLATLAQNLPDRYVNYREHDRLLRELEANKVEVRTEMVTRAEHKEHWDSIDRRNGELQRQIEEIKRIEGSTWGTRDEIQRIQRELDDSRAILQRLLVGKDRLPS